MRRGLAMGIGAYAIWGMSALYWPLLLPAHTAEILAHRIIWSLAALVVLATAFKRWRHIRAHLRKREVALLTLASVLTTINWGAFIYATTHDRVLEASMGYFIAPLVLVALGVSAFRERPSRTQWVAVAIGAAAVVVLTATYGDPPWIAVTLALTFGLYGSVKKRVGVPAVDGMVIETAVVLPLAIGFVAYAEATGSAEFGHVSAGHSVLMIGASFVMLTPMLLFSAASNLIPLSTLGLLQYLEPVLQFLIGVLVFHEDMPVTRWVSFALVWTAVSVLAYDVVRNVAARQRTGTVDDSDAAIIP